MRNSLKFRYLHGTAAAIFLFLHVGVAADIEQPLTFDPTKGFKPAQSDLTGIYLQIAGSLQYYGSPVPYLRHLKSELARIGAEFKQKQGTEMTDYCPLGLGDEAFVRLTKNWDYLAPRLGLEKLAKSTGALMVTAIEGNNGEGTVAVDILKTHQTDVYNAMADGSKTGFQNLQSQLVDALCLSPKASPKQKTSTRAVDGIEAAASINASMTSLYKKLDVALSPTDAGNIETALSSLFTIVGQAAEAELRIGIVEQALTAGIPKYTADSEAALSDSEREIYAAFLREDHFTKADFATMDQFYKTAYNKLSERGKEEMDHRLWEGMRR